MEINKEIGEVPAVKPEPLDNYSEHDDFELHFSEEEVDLGREFKAELLDAEETPGSDSAVSIAAYKLIYCANCDVTWDFSTQETNCISCKSILTCKCGRCLKVFSSVNSLENHLYRYCNERPKYNCHYCSFKSFHKSNLVLHLKKKHTSTEPDHKKCPKCSKTFSLRTNLTRHNMLCGQSKDHKRTLMFYSCAECDYKTDRKTTLSEHIESKHLPWDLSRNKCDRCGKGFLQPRYLKNHLRVCGQSKENRALGKRLCCAHCDYRTDKKQNLRDHVLGKHLPVDPNLNRCQNCGKNFSHKTGLKRHAKICGGKAEVLKDLKSFSCDLCEYKTYRKDHFARHNQRMHGPVFKCDNCRGKFKSEEKLKKHGKRGCKKRELPTLVPRLIKKLK